MSAEAVADDGRWLYVGAFVPQENARHAGGRVAFENLQNLRRQHAVVDAVVCTTEPEAVAPAPADVLVLRQRHTDLLAYLIAATGSLGLRQMVTAPVLHTRLNRQAQQEIEKLMRRHRYAGVFADFTQSILLVQRSAAAAECTVPLTACIADVFVQRMLRSNRPLERWLTGAVMRDEQELLGGVQRLLTLSLKDSQLAKALYTLDQVDTKPFNAPAWCASVSRRPEQIDRSALLFFANFEREENSGAAQWFANHAFAAIRAVRPDVTLTLVGTGSDAMATSIACDGISGTGFIEDPSAEFSRCALAIAPLFKGAGVKFKVLEALAAGLSVVGTPVALEGIAPEPRLVSASAQHFAKTVLEQLERGTTP
jgi:hypothetical protein